MKPLGRLSMLAVIGLTIILANPSPALTPTEKLNNLPVMNGTTLKASTSPVTIQISSLAIYSYDDINLVQDIIYCESNNNHDVWGRAGEYGVAQFKSGTFYWLAEKAGIQNPDWKSEDQQIYLLGWALQNGYENHWTCYEKVM